MTEFTSNFQIILIIFMQEFPIAVLNNQVFHFVAFKSLLAIWPAKTCA